MEQYLVGMQLVGNRGIMQPAVQRGSTARTVEICQLRGFYKPGWISDSEDRCQQSFCAGRSGDQITQHIRLVDTLAGLFQQRSYHERIDWIATPIFFLRSSSDPAKGTGDAEDVFGGEIWLAIRVLSLADPCPDVWCCTEAVVGMAVEPMSV